MIETPVRIRDTVITIASIPLMTYRNSIWITNWTRSSKINFIQILFLYVIRGIDAMVITVSLILTGVSIINSFLIICKKYTSNLRERDLREVNDFIHENGYVDSSMNIGYHFNLIRSFQRRAISMETKFLFVKICLI